MIRFKDIARFIGAEPFRPFRITLSSGRTIDIRHPEMVEAGPASMTIHTFWSDNPEDAKEHYIRVSLLLTESVEPLDTAPARSQGAS